MRKALLMAVDRDSIAKTLYKGFAKTPTSAMPTVTMGFNPDTRAVPYDADGAKQLLADAGHSDLSLTLNTYAATSTPVPDIQKLAETIIAFWSAVGASIPRSTSPACGHVPAAVPQQAAQGAALIAGPTSAYVEPGYNAWARQHRSSGRRPPYTTIVGDAKLDGYIDQLNAELDPDARTTLGRGYGDYLDEQLYRLPMITVSSLVKPPAPTSQQPRLRQGQPIRRSDVLDHRGNLERVPSWLVLEEGHHYAISWGSSRVPRHV